MKWGNAVIVSLWAVDAIQKQAAAAEVGARGVSTTSGDSRDLTGAKQTLGK